MSNYNTVIEATPVQSPVWMVSTVWNVEPLDEMVERTRSSDGRFLKVNCKLSNATFTQSESNVALAEAYGVEADEIFVGKRQ